MAIKVNLEDYVKVQLVGATQSSVEFNGDVKLYREMTVAKPFDVYKCVENGAFVSAKKFKIDTIRVAPDSLNIIGLVSNKGELFNLSEVDLDKKDVTIKYAEKLIDEGSAMVRKGTGLLLSMVKNS